MGSAGRDDLSGGQAFGVAREHGRLADVVEAQVEHRDALHADAAAGVRRRPVAERIDVRADLLHLCNRRARGVIVIVVVVVVVRTPSADGRRDRRRATRPPARDAERERRRPPRKRRKWPESLVRSNIFPNLLQSTRALNTILIQCICMPRLIA